MKQVGRIDLKGAQGAYVLEINTNAFCRLEELAGVGFVEAVNELQGGSPRMTLIRHFVKATLVSPADATLDDVGRIIDDIGGVDGIAAALLNNIETPSEATPAKARKGRG